MNPRFFLSILLLCTLPKLKGQDYIIRLKDKNNSGFTLQSAERFLSPAAMEKRKKFQITIDSSDLPVTRQYIENIQAIPNVRLVSISKWLNQLLVYTTDSNAIIKINALPFVGFTKQFSAKAAPTFQNGLKSHDEIDSIHVMPQENAAIGLAYGSSRAQIELHHGRFLHEKGLLGKGIKVAVFDGGFQGYQTNKAFDSLRFSNSFKGTWDLVSNDGSVNEDDAHGTYCLSIMAANMPGIYVGTAPHADYYLFRTENVSSEFPVEEHHWVVAAEMADSLGIDIISSSLGYSTFDLPNMNHSYASMNGFGTTVSIGASMASKKGIVVVNSAGNSGNDSWKYITAPADAENILSVGAVDLVKQVAPFSSFGPSADGRIKPEIASVGWNASIVNRLGTVSLANGTSFSAPIISGLTACLWQAFPDCSNLDVMDAIKKSSDKYSKPDTRTGYGIPDMEKAFQILERTNILKKASSLLNGMVLKAFPVPFSGNLNVLYEARSKGSLHLDLVTTDGKIVRSMQVQIDMPGPTLVNWEGLELLPSGQYIIKYRAGSVSGAIRVMK